MRSVLILGLGLIGGSAGMALRRQGWRVGFVDPRVTLEEAQAAGAADHEGGDADVVLLATPVDVAVRLLPTLRTAGVITSACSVMRPLRNIAPPGFVAGHPMAGSQETGLQAARPDLYEGKVWFLDARDEQVEQLVRDCGAVPRPVTADEHDAAVALTSHLPQVLSTALGAYLNDRDLLDYAGSGLRTVLRLAGSEASVWTPILAANRDNLAPHAAAVTELVREIVNGDPADAFARAQATWRALEEKSRS